MSADVSKESAMLPLKGVRVIDFTQMVAGPHCTLWLASLGAEVIRVESPKRPDPFRMSMMKAGLEPTLNNSAIWIVTNLMKRSCGIDIATPEGQRLCHELVRQSDVVVANFRPGILEQFNMGYGTLSEINPGIVMATITGYGYHGAFAAFQATAPPMHAFSGICVSTGYPGGPPEQTFITYGDVVSGHMAVPSILAALYQRELTGEGRYIDLAMAEALVTVAPELVLRASLFEEKAPRRGNDEEGFAPHGCYPCAGRDRWIAIATFDDVQWRELTRVMGLAEESSDPRFETPAARFANREELDKLLGEATRSFDPVELAKALQEVGVAAAPSRTAEDVLVDEQLLEDGFLQQVAQPDLEEVYLPALPWRMETDAGSIRPMGPAPDLGEGTREILGEILGLSDDAWEDLLARGIVA
jgi:crotonobetainyl-CoA:carnitine CoA-transferase CaiB-like acyl-CoA transferase